MIKQLLLAVLLSLSISAQDIGPITNPISHTVSNGVPVTTTVNLGTNLTFNCHASSIGNGAWVVLSSEQELNPFPFPLQHSAGLVMIDANVNYIGLYVMTPMTANGFVRAYNIPNINVLVGVTIVSQCLHISPNLNWTWKLSNGWVTTIIP